jgi:hypothetical protein
MMRMQQSVESTQAIAESDAIAVERTLAGDSRCLSRSGGAA